MAEFSKSAAESLRSGVEPEGRGLSAVVCLGVLRGGRRLCRFVCPFELAFRGEEIRLSIVWARALRTVLCSPVRRPSSAKGANTVSTVYYWIPLKFSETTEFLMSFSDTDLSESLEGNNSSDPQ